MPRVANQHSKRVKVLKYVKVADGWRFSNVLERNGKVVRDHVPISGCDERHPEGTYYLEWYEAGNQRRRKAIHDFGNLVEQARRKAHRGRGRAGGGNQRASKTNPRRQSTAARLQGHRQIPRVHRAPPLPPHLLDLSLYAFAPLAQVLRQQRCRRRFAGRHSEIHDRLLQAGPRQSHRVRQTGGRSEKCPSVSTKPS